MILKLYNGSTTPVYTPTNLVLSAYSGYVDDRKTYNGKFKIEQLVGDTWSIAQNITTTASTTLSVKLSDILDSSAIKVRCYLYSNEETPMLIDVITLDIVDDFSSMLSVQNNKTYVDGGNVYCATLDADTIFSNDINFTGTITGGDANGGGIIKSHNYVVDTSGLKINLYDGTIDSKNFKVSNTGVIEAKDANLTGIINANSGKIGTISNGLYFNISEDGELYTGSKSSLYSDLNGVYVGHNGICCGGAGYNSTKYQFRVDSYGQMSCSYANMSYADISNADISYGSISYANISYGKIGSFNLNSTSLYSNNRTSIGSPNTGCYIGVDGVSYKGSQYTFKIDDNGDCYSDRLVSNDGLIMIAHNSISSDCSNGNLVIGYGNENHTNIYGTRINFLCDTQNVDNRKSISFYEDDYKKVVFRPYYSNDVGSAIYLGTDNYRWDYVYGNNGNFITIYENGTALSSKYQAKGSYFKNGSTVTGSLYLGSNSYYVNSNGNGVFYVCEADNIRSTRAIGFNVTSTSFYKKWSDGDLHDIITGTSTAVGVGYANATTNLRGKTIQCNGGTSWTSDENLKKDFNEFDDRYDVLFDNLKPIKFKYILGTSDRFHSGFKAQDVEKALEISNLTTQEFAGINIIPLDSRETEIDKNGKEVDIELSECNYLLDKGINEKHSLGYIEFIPLNTWQIQKLKTKVKEQQNEIDELKQIINSILDKIDK